MTKQDYIDRKVQIYEVLDALPHTSTEQEKLNQSWYVNKLHNELASINKILEYSED